MKTKLWDAVRDNWGQITGIGTVVVLLHLFVMNVMINSAVDNKLANQDIGTDSKIVSMDDEIDLNGAKAEAAIAAAAAVNTRVDGNERRVELAFGVLLGRDPE